MQNIRTTIGDLIKQGRKTKKLKQAELAELVGVDPKYISRIETGLSYASLSVIEKIFNVLDIKFDENFINFDEYDKDTMINLLVKDIKNLSISDLKLLNQIVKKFVENL